jgi:hypothetical protein
MSNLTGLLLPAKVDQSLRILRCGDAPEGSGQGRSLQLMFIKDE